MRRELVVALVGSALALFVYAGATATDARVGALITAVQTALESEMEFDLFVFIETETVLGPLDIPAAVAVLVLLFGGLPLAVFGLLIERQWVGVPPQQRRYVRVPYAVLMFQIVSMGLSGLCLAVMGAAFIPGLSEMFLRVYLAVQILASIAVIPVWRRLLSSDVLTGSLRLNRA
jgi:hypothetical protein